VQHQLDNVRTTDPSLKQLTRAILQAQSELRRLASKDAWLAYLRVEAAVNARQDEIIDRALALAYRARPR
jgi:hypothetical protein